jgi:hypothetical protein
MWVWRRGAWAAAAEQVVRSLAWRLSACWTVPMLCCVSSASRSLRTERCASVFAGPATGRLCLGAGAHAAEPSEAKLQQVELKADRALKHTLMNEQRPRMERVEMARRLARWLLSPMASGPRCQIQWNGKLTRAPTWIGPDSGCWVATN